MMIRDNAIGHVFDYDKDGKYVFVMAVVAKGTIPEALMIASGPICKWCAEGYLTVNSSVSSARVHPDTPVGRVVCMTPQRAETPVQRETKDNPGETV